MRCYRRAASRGRAAHTTDTKPSATGTSPPNATSSTVSFGFLYHCLDTYQAYEKQAAFPNTLAQPHNAA